MPRLPKRRTGLLACLAVVLYLLISTPVLAEGLSGIWVGQIPGRNGEPQDVAFKFTQDGAMLAGKLYGDYRSTPIVEGKISAGELSFVLIAQEQNGNQINETRLRFTGIVKDGEIELTRERESATNAASGGPVQFRGNAKQTFRLRRLL
jgi:hypothetical protein